jgi:hypothetical protein
MLQKWIGAILYNVLLPGTVEESQMFWAELLIWKGSDYQLSFSIAL